MTLVPVCEFVDTIAKAAEVDEGAAMTLLQLATYDYLADTIEQVGPALQREVSGRIEKRATVERRELVRTFVAKRMANEPVSEVLEHAADLAIGISEVSKDDAPWKDEARDRGGRWTRAIGGFMSALTAGPSEQDKAGAGQIVGALQGGKYQHLATAGSVLAATGLPGSSAIGSAAHLAAAVGPEAQNVLGPHLQRTAYRYRGTEKTADAALRRQVKEVTPAAVKLALEDPHEAAALGGSAAQGASRNPTPAGGVLGYYARSSRARSMTDQQLALRARGDVAAGYLSDQVPNPQETALSIAAGQVPPSLGVIIDAQGHVSSESMGYNGDHYLPFDLKNLRSLHGGQYVRTRAAGGPTTEDIYTGLLSGARQMQVVSNSGVFTMEFDPDLRGGRRYSDKAAQMVGRYQHLLDAVDSRTLLANDLTPAEIRGFQREAFNQQPNNPTLAKDLADEKIAQERQRRKFNVKEPEEIEAEADAELRDYVKNRPRGDSLGNQDLADKKRELVAELYDEQHTNTVRELKLDGEGYYRAMRSLKQEFPYYIRSVDFEERPLFLTDRKLNTPGQKLPSRGGGTDRGYLSPAAAAGAEGYNHARATLSSGAAGGKQRSGLNDFFDSKPKEEVKPATDAPADAAAAGATASAGTTPVAAKPFSGVFADESYTYGVTRSASKLQPLVSLIDGGNQEDNKKMSWETVKNEAPSTVALWLLQHHASTLGEGLRGQKIPADQVEALSAALRDPSVADRIRAGAESDNAAMNEDAKQALPKVLEALDFAQPFTPGNNEIAAADANKPLGFNDVVAAGMDTEALKKVGQNLPPDQQRVAHQIFVGRTDVPGEVRRLKTSLGATPENESDATKASRLANDHKSLQDLMHAWSYVHAHQLAQQAKIIRAGGMGSPDALPFPEPARPAAPVPPAARASQAVDGFSDLESDAEAAAMADMEQESSHSKPVGKRLVTVHPPGSPLANQVAKLLRQSGPRTPSSPRPRRVSTRG